MKKFAVCVLLLIAVLLPAAYAEDIVAYVESNGFTIEEVDKSPGWRTCNLIEMDDAQTLTFSDCENAYYIVSGSSIELIYDESALRELLVSLVEEFEWDVSFFWPDYDHDDQIAVSYGIERDLSKTKSNYDSKDEYISALRSWLKADEEAKWEAFHEKVSALNVPKIESNAILDCMSSVTGTRALSTIAMSAPNSYAQFMIGPTFTLAGPGGNDVECGKFLHPDLGEWTLDERWSLYGQILKYISEHRVDVIADAMKLSSDISADEISFRITIWDETYTYVSDYFPFTDHIETIIYETYA